MIILLRWNGGDLMAGFGPSLTNADILAALASSTYGDSRADTEAQSALAQITSPCMPSPTA